MVRFTTPVEHIAVLVVDKNHARFGQIGSLNLHDWREYGTLDVSFKDGREEFYDGMMQGDSPSSVQSFDRTKSGDNGVDGLAKKYIELNIGDKNSLIKKYNEVFNNYFFC